ncbi:MAG: hypothetical protein AAGI71_06965 [Bacteroidota bacterium]
MPLRPVLVTLLLAALLTGCELIQPSTQTAPGATPSVSAEVGAVVQKLREQKETARKWGDPPRKEDRVMMDFFSEYGMAIYTEEGVSIPAIRATHEEAMRLIQAHEEHGFVQEQIAQVVLDNLFRGTFETSKTAFTDAERLFYLEILVDRVHGEFIVILQHLEASTPSPQVQRLAARTLINLEARSLFYRQLWEQAQATYGPVVGPFEDLWPPTYRTPDGPHQPIDVADVRRRLQALTR